MSGFIFDQGNLNIAALTVPGAYVQLMDPMGGAIADPSNAIAIAGTGSWGEVNKPLGPWGEISSAAAAIGQFDVEKWKTDKSDLMRACMQAFQQAQTDVSLQIWGCRISDGTDVAASLTLVDTTSGTPLTGMILPAKYTGTGGNTIKCLISAAGPANLYNVTFVASFSGQTISETYFNVAGSASGASPFWANLRDAILLGNQSRGPSQLIGTPTSVSTTALNPAAGTFTLTGGTDGRAGVTSSSFFGSDVIGNRQGIYAFRGLPIVPAYVYCAGMTDSTKFATIQAFCTQEIIRAVLPFPAGTSTTTAVTNRASLGISDKRIIYAKNHIYWVDPISGQTILTDPVAIMIARAASLSPQLSPLNKPVYGVVGAEQNRHASDETGLLNMNGIWAISNPCLGSPFWGIISDSTTSLNPVERPVAYQRLKDYIGIQFARILLKYVGKPQGLFDPDETRAGCKSDIDSVMRSFFEAKLIVDWQSQCDAQLNNPDSIQAGYMFGKLDYVPYGTVRYVVLNLGTQNHLSAGQALALLEQQGG
jgi:hypothetical protein